MAVPFRRVSSTRRKKRLSSLLRKLSRDATRNCVGCGKIIQLFSKCNNCKTLHTFKNRNRAKYSSVEKKNE